jgi:hypothetical protein
LAPNQPSAPSTPSRAFLEHFHLATTAVRVALTDLLGEFGGASSVALDLSRRVEIDKTLAWRVLRLVRATDPFEVIAHVPGPTGFRILSESFRLHGAGAADLEALQSAIEGFDAMVREHAGDRSTLDLILTSCAPGRLDGKQLEAGRRQAFRGNSAVWGVQARVRYAIDAIAPSLRRPEVADVANIAGFEGFRRLRPVTGWPLINLQANGGTGRVLVEPMDSVDDGAPPLLEEFNEGPVPQFEVLRQDNKVFFTLPKGPVGNAGTFSCTFGWLHRAVGPVHCTGSDDSVDFMAYSVTPVELMQFDILVHRDMPLLTPPRVFLRGEMPGPRWKAHDEDNSRELPLVERAVDLGSPPIVSSPHISRFSDPVARACAALGRPLEEFRGFRVVVRYPSIPTRLGMSFRLPPPG